MIPKLLYNKFYNSLSIFLRPLESVLEAPWYLNYYSYSDKNKKSINNNYDKKDLGPYLAGLIEGDGHIYTPSKYKDSNGEKNMPHIEICFDIKDLPFFEKIKDVLKGGYINIRPNNKSGRLFIKKMHI